MFRSIDLSQVKVLTRYALTSEWRMASVRSGWGRRRKMSRASAYWMMILYLAIGAMTLRLFAHNASGEAFVSAVGFFLLYVSMVTASNIFLSFGTGFLSPDEAQIISFLPVTSETFFLSRLAVLLCYSAGISLLLTIGPVIGMELIHPDLPAHLMLACATVLCSIAAAMGIIVLYGVLLRRASPKARTKVLGYIQFFGTFITIMGFVVISNIHRGVDFSPLTISLQPWLALLPSFWFASLVALASGIAYGLYPWLALFAFVALAMLAWLSHVLLSKHYQSEILDFTVANSSQEKSKRRTGDGVLYRLAIRFARSDEARAVFMIFRAQFRFDHKFRMGMLAMLPITIIYLLIAIINGGVVDPFTATLKKAATFNLVYMIALLMPMLLLQAVLHTENYKAAWIFFCAPIERSKLLLSIRNALTVSIVLPYMVVLAVVFSYFMPVAHAVQHTLVLLSLGGIIFQILMLLSPKMPFAQPRAPNRGGIIGQVAIGLLVPIPMVLLIFEIHYGYRSAGYYWPSLAFLVTLVALLEGAVRARVRKKLEQEEFEG